MEVKHILKYFLALSLTITFANCDCDVRIKIPRENRPIFSKVLGSNVVEIEHDLSGGIKMYDGEAITGNCATKFDTVFYYLPDEPSEADPYYEFNHRHYDETTTPKPVVDSLHLKRSVDLYCNGKTITAGILRHRVTESTEFACEHIEWGIYETQIHLPWCSAESVSYILATTNLEPNMIVGSICYDLKNMRLESLRYTTYNYTLDQELRLMPYPIDISPELLSTQMKVEGFEHHANVELLNGNINSWNYLLKAARYGQKIIVEDEAFERYNKILEVSWWSNLYQTNWHRFLQAFKERTAEVVYDIHLGASGKLRYPELEYCNGKETGEMKLEAYNGNISAYIWAYVRAVDNSDEFVFIGYNSPFYEFFNSTEIIFCQDICSEIPWLSKVRSTFQYSALGISFCCTPQSVRTSGILNGFPRLYEPFQLILETTTPATFSEVVDKKTAIEIESEENVIL